MASSRSAQLLPAGSGASLATVIRRAGRCGAVFAALAVLAMRTEDGWVSRIDQRTISALPHGRHPAGIAMAKAVSALAEREFVFALLAAQAIPQARRDGWRAACAPGLAVVSGAMARRMLSQVIARPRPPAAVWLTEPEGFSLPSKHTTLAALAAGALADATSTTGMRRSAAIFFAAAAAGTSRVYLGVHWPSDVLAAWLFAEGWLSLTGVAHERGTGGQSGTSATSR
ncbi:MAG TPA: phosphatase PAP2 family protein [Streptosporangiaceae bacterium]|nr:phosphatase PAP2 family protein [Streptosporangiaceae bacterium]